MAILEIPDHNEVIRDFTQIQSFLAQRGIELERWQADQTLAPDADQDAVLAAYRSFLEPYMARKGYRVADVIRIKPDMPNLDAARQKFLKEHRHSEDEVRFFVEGKGYFWFNLENNDPIFAVLCEPGDLISVPARTAHWFDMGANPDVTAIRMFIDPSGWVPQYTESGIEARYNKPYDQPL